TCSRTSRQSVCKVSRVSKRARKSVSTSRKVRRASRPPTSRRRNPRGRVSRAASAARSIPLSRQISATASGRARTRAAFGWTPCVPCPLHSLDHRIPEAGARDLLRAFHHPCEVVSDDLVADRLFQAGGDEIRRLFPSHVHE